MAPRGRGDFSFHARYGSVITKAGVAAIPSALFFYQGELGLKPEEAWFACVVLSYRWTSDIPYPSLAKICKRTGVPRATITRYRRGLQEAQWDGQPLLRLVERTRANGAQSSNGYDLTGLVSALEALIMRDRAYWFRGNPLAGEDLDDGVDELGSPVDNSELVIKSPFAADVV